MCLYSAGGGSDSGSDQTMEIMVLELEGAS